MKKIALAGIISFILIIVVGCSFVRGLNDEMEPLVEVMGNEEEEEETDFVDGTSEDEIVIDDSDEAVIIENEIEVENIIEAEAEAEIETEAEVGTETEAEIEIEESSVQENELEEIENSETNSETNSDLLNVQLNEENKMIVEMDHDDYLLTITFGFSGPNDIYSFDHFNYKMKDDSEVDVLVSSDFIGPYIMRNLNISSEGVNQQFTGGWHGVEANATGSPTAECIDVVIEADGTEIKDLTDFSVSNLKITVINEINPYNDSNPCLEEMVVYRITKGHIDVRVTQKAIEDLEVLRYYGFQTQNRTWAGNIEYFDENEEIITSSTVKSSYGFVKENGMTRKYKVTADDGLREITVGLSPSGLGNYEFLGDSLATCFTLDYGKSYFHLINEKTLVLNQGESVFIEGYYHFFD